MSILKKIFLVAFSIICISFSLCYAIDENQLTTNNPNPVVATPNQNPTSNTSVTTNIVDNTTTTNSTMQNEPATVDANNYTENPSTTVTREATTVSSVSTGSNKSTVTNILNIALIVVGFLLILLAVAILIRLK